MGRYFKVRSQSDIDRRLGQGRGQGSGTEYLPWFYVHDIASRGRSHKIPSLKVDRVHHLLSDLEANCCRALEHGRKVRQIREQFALLPYGLTVFVAASLGIRHPVYPGTNVPVVMTSDFCVDVQDGDHPEETREIAIAVKYKVDLKKQRVRELLTIECETNRILGRPWFLFTDETISPVTQRNLVWLWHGARLPDRLNSPELLAAFCREFLEKYQADQTLQSVLDQCALEIRLSRDDLRRLFKFAAWNQLLPLDLHEPVAYLRFVTLARSPEHVLHFATAA